MARLGRGQPFKPLTRRVVFNNNILFDAASNSGLQVAQSSYTFSRTVAGNDRLLTVDVAILSAGQSVSSIVDDFGGGNVAMTLIGGQTTVTSFGRVESWKVLTPAIGTKTIQVNLTGSVSSVAMAVSYTGVHQTTPTEAFNSTQATNVGAADAIVPVTPIADNTWLHAAVATDDGSITSGQTSRNNVSGGASLSGADEDAGPITPAAATNLFFTGIGALATWAIGGYAIRPITAASDGALAGSSTLSFAPAAAMTGAGALLGASMVAFTPTAVAVAIGALLGSSVLTFIPTAMAVASGALLGASTIAFTPAGVMAGAGALLGSSAITFSPAAALSGAISLEGSSTLSFSLSGTLQLPAGFMAGTANLFFAPTAEMQASGILIGASTFSLLPAAALSGSIALAGSSQVSLTATGSIALAGDISAIASLSFSSQGVMTASGAISGSSLLSLLASGLAVDPTAPTNPTRLVINDIAFSTGTLRDASPS